MEQPGREDGSGAHWRARSVYINMDQILPQNGSPLPTPVLVGRGARPVGLRPRKRLAVRPRAQQHQVGGPADRYAPVRGQPHRVGRHARHHRGPVRVRAVQVPDSARLRARRPRHGPAAALAAGTHQPLTAPWSDLLKWPGAPHGEANQRDRVTKGERGSLLQKKTHVQGPRGSRTGPTRGRQEQHKRQL